MALGSFCSFERLTRPGPLFTYPSFLFADRYGFHDLFRLRAGEIDRQQTVLEVRREHFHALGEHKAALELSRRNAAVEELPGFIVLLAAPDDELVLLH